ncbi:glycosyltransferase family 2 protein [Zunongwangia sp. HGR-M22]|uniref:glycosyltransferase family 2 protein n=1 Tax=Zunongwangia sp. HGR-M22 TaxID=3015168 RepID=UPI0022DD20EB|nr:glycosyltransferase family 2 protein [Zunongwangia sp. HGR-M22]WBL24866.1 glycosyltransferase family 2 protein [Zunongwangia sp. HGR-M22]
MKKLKTILKNVNSYFIFYFYVSRRKKYDEENPKTYPIIIISFNQFFYLKKLVDFLEKRNYENIVIIDNASTYPELLKYLELLKKSKSVRIHRLHKNYGHLVFWKRKEFRMLYGRGYHVVTDPDVVPIKSCPDNFLAIFKAKLDKYLEVSKVGFSLSLDDIPISNPLKNKIMKWESQFWEHKTKDGDYLAEIDTTFALYRPYETKLEDNFFKAIRTKFPLTAIHGGWYIDAENLTKEQQYYFKTSNNSNTWKIKSL